MGCGAPIKSSMSVVPGTRSSMRHSPLNPAAELLAVLDSGRVIAQKMGRATELVEQYPAVYRAPTRGNLSGAHANAIVDAGEIIADEAARGASASRLRSRCRSVFRRRPERSCSARSWSRARVPERTSCLGARKVPSLDPDRGARPRSGSRLLGRGSLLQQLRDIVDILIAATRQIRDDDRVLGHRGGDLDDLCERVR